MDRDLDQHMADFQDGHPVYQTEDAQGSDTALTAEDSAVALPPSNSSVDEILTIDGFYPFSGLHEGTLTEILFQKAFISETTYDETPQLKITVIKNLIVIFQALCLLQDVWPNPKEATRSEKRNAFRILESMIPRLFKKVTGPLFKKAAGRLSGDLVRRYTTARRRGCKPGVTSPVALIAHLHNLVDEWNRFEDNGKPKHPTTSSNVKNPNVIIEMRLNQWELIMLKPEKTEELFTTMWPWIPSRSRELSWVKNVPAKNLRVIKHRKPSSKSNKDREKNLEAGAAKFGDVVGDISNIMVLPIRTKPIGDVPETQY